MRESVWIFVCAVAATSVLGAQLNVNPSRPVNPGQSVASQSCAERTHVVGQVLDHRQFAVPYVRVQLRDLMTGAVLSAQVTSDSGEYRFAVGHPGTYVVEMTTSGGVVVAVSNAGRLLSCVPLETEIRLAGSWDEKREILNLPVDYRKFFGMTSLATMTAATIELAAKAQISAVDAGEPVSP